MFLLNCKPFVKTLGPFSSSSVDESKKVGVFLWEYYPVKIIINDSINLDFKEVFAEKVYQYYSYKDLRYKILDDYTQIRINSNNKFSLLKYFRSWNIENFDLTGNFDGLIRVYNRSYPPDTLVVKILKVDIAKNGGPGKDDKKEIGSFILIKKQ